MTAERGCGRRKEGGIYAVCPMGPDGQPIEYFIYDPPKPINPITLGLTPKGVLLVQQDGITHIMDWIGEENYPNPTDFVEEARRQGFSRRLGPGLDYSKIGKGSRHLCAHPRAYWSNFLETYEAIRWTGGTCPKCKIEHGTRVDETIFDFPREMCAGLWWEDVRGGRPVDVADAIFGSPWQTPDLDNPRAVRRKMPSFTYDARRPPEGVEPDYRPALFCWFPIHRLEIVRAQDGSHREAVDKASRASIPVLEVDE